MRSACLLFILVIAVYDVSGYSPKERCPPQNCLANSSECEILWLNAECQNPKNTCCSLVKEPYRKTCAQHLGSCMSSCNKDLQRPATDCGPNEVCCVLV